MFLTTLRATRSLYKFITISSVMLFSLSAQASESKQITFGLSSWIGFAPLYIASAKHYFGDYDVKFINMESGINAALLSGDIDMADLSLNQIIGDNLKGHKVKVFLPIDYSYGADAIVARIGISDVKQLHGLTIPLNTTSYSELLLSYALSSKGMSLNSVTTKDVPASDVPSILLSGHAKAGVTWSPHVEAIIANPNFHILFSSKEVPGLISDSMCAQYSWLKSHPQAARAIITGMLRGEAYIERHPRLAFKIVGSSLGISPSSAQYQYKGVINFTLNQMHIMMTYPASYKAIITYAKSINLVKNLMKETGTYAKSATADVISHAGLLFPEYVSSIYAKNYK